MRENDLTDIETRCNRATKGPWQSFVESRDHFSGSNFIRTGGLDDRSPDIELTGASVDDQDFIRGSKTTWLLSHLQAALGATCMAAGAYAIYHNASVWRDGTADLHGAMLLVWIPMALGLVIVGFGLIRTAFMPEREEDPPR